MAAAGTQAPGAAFLQRRLERARALPPAERSADVQAFLTSVQLGQEVCELLPLRASGAGRARTQQAVHGAQASLVLLLCAYGV